MFLLNLSEKRRALIKQLWLTVASSLCFLIIGLVRGYSSSAIPSMEEHDPFLTSTQERKSWIGAIPPVGAFTGCLTSGPMMSKFGRKTTLMLAMPIWTFAWLLLAFAPSYEVVLAARICTGFGVGLVLATVQVYVGECCNAKIRGRLGSMPTLSMSLGILLSYLFGYSFYWRYLAIVGAVFSVITFVCLLSLPESPVWLESAEKKGVVEAREWLHLDAFSSTQKNASLSKKNEEMKSLFTKEVFTAPEVWKPFVICFALLVFQQISGIDAVIFFTVEIFNKSGSKLDPKIATICVGAVQLICGAVSTLFIDKVGRRPLLLASTAAGCFAMSAMGVAYYLDLKDDPWLGYLPLLSLVIFMVGYSVGLAGVPFLLLGEVFPAQYRSQLSSTASAFNLLTMFAVIKTYHLFNELLTAAGTFWFYAGCCLLGFFFVLFFVPETKGKTLEEIETYFRKSADPKTDSSQQIPQKNSMDPSPVTRF